MSENQIKVDVLIATYKRERLLGKLLESLGAQRLEDGVSLRIIVIDNDAKKTAKVTTETFFRGTSLPHIYDVQSEKNIALARNKALSYASADYLAFIDDDEWAESDWLQKLLHAMKKYDADVVFGPVVPWFLENAPEWIRRGGFFTRQENKTGDIKQDGATGNALIRNTDKLRGELMFKSLYGLTGGEDTELFSRLHRKGAKLVWCNEAKVYEEIAVERMNVKWLALRAMRGGQVFATITYKKLSLVGKGYWLLKRAGLLFLCCVIFPFALFLGREKWVWVLCKIMANGGQLGVLFSEKIYQEYK